MNGSGYTIVQAGAEVPAEEFVRRYVDLKDPAAGCRPCPDYGRYWTCPPYDVPAAEYWGRYRTVLLRGMQFHFTRELLERRFTPEELAEYTRELTAAHARRMDEHLRALYPGAAVLTTGGACCARRVPGPQGGPAAIRRRWATVWNLWAATWGPPPGENWAGSCCGPGGISCRDT